MVVLNVCPKCGAPLPESGASCPACGDGAAATPAFPQEGGGTVQLADGRTLPEEPAPSGRGPGPSEGATISEEQTYAPGRKDESKTIPLATESDGATVKSPDETPAPKPLIGSGRRAPASSGRGILASAKRGRPGSTADGKSAAPAAEDEVPESFDDGKYEILKEIARGGMGAVYKARQVDLNRIVALKVMLAGALASDDEKKRFLREAEASAKLKHPNIVPVYDIGEVDGNLYFTMDFVEGAPLSEKRLQFSRDKLLDVMIKVCDAVAYAHMRGIIHRDLKPANIMIDKRAEPLIMDFGLAKEMTAENQDGDPDVRTREGSVMGTPHYMPPEQAEGLVSEIDVRSDVYSLGVILYELWTGRLPFLAKRVAELLMQVIEQEPPAPRSLDPSVPWEIEAVALKAMEKSKAKRYDSALDMKRDLERFRSGEPILARKANVLQRARKWTWRHRYSLAASGAGAGVVALALGIAYRQATRAARERFETASGRVAEADAAVGKLAADVAALRSGTLGTRLERCKAEESSLRTLQANVGSAATELDLVMGQIGPEAAREKDDANRLASTLDRLHDALAAVSDDERAELERRKKVAEKTASARAALADAEALALRASDGAARARERERLDALKRTLNEVIALGGAAEVQEAQQRVEKLSIDLAAIEARLEHRKTAEDLLGRGRAALAVALRTSDPDERHKKAREAVRLLEDGEKEDASLGGLADEKAKAQLASAQALMDLGYFRLAEDEAADVKSPAGEALAAKARDSGAAALANRARLEAGARALQLAESEKDARARARAADEAREMLTPMERAPLSHDDAERCATLLRSARYDAALAHAQELVDAAEAFDRDHPGDATGASDKAWQEAIARTQQLESDHVADKATVETMLARAQGERGLARLAAAKRLASANDPHGARKKAQDALADLKAGRLGSQLVEAETILAAATREIETPTGMVLVPELSSVRLGGDERNPERTVKLLPAFYISRVEVTNEEFHDFVAQGGYERADLWDAGAPRESLVDRTGARAPLDWENGAPPRGTERLPVTGVSWWEARAYARFRKMELPSDEQWEAAARVAADPTAPGKLVSLAYPWGDEWEPAGPEVARTRQPAPTGPEGVHAVDRSFFGCRDMAGSVAEWVRASEDRATVPCPEGHAPVRGGSYLAPLRELMRLAHRSLPERSLRAPNVGFRLAMTPEKAARPGERLK